MNPKLQGRMIRQKRLEKNWSQEGLSSGICAASYLSKIEQGTVEAKPDVIRPLLDRLGLCWKEDPDFCREMGKFMDSCYELLLSGEGTGQFREALKEREEACKNSPFYLDWLLLTAAGEGSLPEETEDFLPAMETRQKHLYWCLSGTFDQLLTETNRSFYYFGAGADAYQRGEYSRAQELLLRGQELASREGALRVLLNCRIFLGNCDSDLGFLEQAQGHYDSACRMARALGEKLLADTIVYNLAATQIQTGMHREALENLQAHPMEGRLYFHKLAICYEALGERENALAAVSRAEALETAADGEDCPEMCALVRYRLEHPDYLSDPAYGELLAALMKKLEHGFSQGYVRFHLPWMEEWYAANRKYRQAYELRRKFS